MHAQHADLHLLRPRPRIPLIPGNSIATPTPLIKRRRRRTTTSPSVATAVPAPDSTGKMTWGILESSFGTLVGVNANNNEVNYSIVLQVKERVRVEVRTRTWDMGMDEGKG